MKILFLTNILPGKENSGGEILSQGLIDALSYSGHEVVVVGYQRKNDSYDHNPDEFIVEKRYIETRKAKFHPILWMMLSFAKGFPYSSAKFYSATYLRKVKDLLSKETYDIVIIDHSQLGWLKDIVLSKKLKLIFNTHNIEHEIYLEHCQKTGSPVSKWIYKREAALIKDMEDALARVAQEVWTLTPHDASYFSTVTTEEKIRVLNVPSHFETLLNRPVVKTCDIGILGTWTWKANMDGLKWFFEAVHPHLPEHLSIQVAGKGADWLHGQYPNVKYCDFISDAQAFMGQAKVIAIPSISGGGVQIKTLAAIASGSSIVATPFALRGISNYPSCVRVADRPEDFASNLVELLASPLVQESCQEAIVWSQKRREQFVSDVANAVNAVKSSPETTSLQLKRPANEGMRENKLQAAAQCLKT